MFRRFSLIVLAFLFVFIILIVGDKMNIELGKINNELEDDLVKRAEHRYDNVGIIIYINEKLLYVIDLDSNKLIKKYVVATGKAKTPSPIGSFRIIEKARWGGGFGSRWMGLNVPWGKYGIHGTNKPYSIGSNASHGCIRMRNKDVEELYDIVKHNTPVSLVRGHFGPFGNGFRTLQPGARGSDVSEVQKRLKMRGYYYGGIDGIYGDGMKRALVKFLKDNNMPITDKIGYSIYKKLDIILMD